MISGPPLWAISAQAVASSSSLGCVRAPKIGVKLRRKLLSDMPRPSSAPIGEASSSAENAHVPGILGWERADNLTEAIAMARSYMGNSAEITMLHQPMIGIADME